jgi:hypothetical protein
MRSSRRPILLIRTFLLLGGLLAPASGLSSAQRTAQSRPAIPSGWNDAAQTLAGKIASVADRSKTISLDVKNVSSLAPTKAAAIRQTIEDDLTQRGFRLEPDSSAETQVTVTLAESARGYVWVAQVPGGDTQRVEIVSAPKIEGTSDHQVGTKLVLQGKLIWRQPAKFVDFAVVPTAGPDAMLIVLEPDRLAYYYSVDLASWQFSRSIPISHSSAWPLQARDPHGSIDVRNAIALLPGIVCSQVLDPDRTRCDFEDLKLVFPGQRVNVPGHEEDQTTVLEERCGEDSIALSTGNGDWTQPDSIQGYLLSALEDARPSGAPMETQGPVISLVADAKQGSARAIVQDLKTGNYEAYLVTADCGQ